MAAGGVRVLRDGDGGAPRGGSAGDVGEEPGRETWASDEDWRTTSTKQRVEDETRRDGRVGGPADERAAREGKETAPLTPFLCTRRVRLPVWPPHPRPVSLL